MVDNVADLDKVYYEVRSYSDGGDMAPIKGNRVTVTGPFDNIANAYLSAFEQIKRDQNAAYQSYPILDIVQIRPVVEQVIPVSIGTIYELHERVSEKLIEIEISETV